jgi:phage-related baseplate assembly protein
MNDSRFTKINDNAEAFYQLPYFAMGEVNREILTTTLTSLWETSEGNSTAFILGLVDLIERQNRLASVDPAEVTASVVRMYEGILNTTLFPGDPVRLFLSTLAAIISMQNSVLDWTQKQNFLRHATGAYLDALAALLGVYRLEAFPAKTTLKYTLGAARVAAVTVPVGTRATVDGRIFFATDTLLVIPAGQLTGEVPATCLTLGAEGNGLLPGQINRIVDVVAGVSAVVNTEESGGGSDVEGDEALRARARMAPGQFSTAGARLSYVYWALTAHGNIFDVSISGPEDRGGERLGEVDVFVMLKNGVIPEAGGAELEAVEKVLNDDKIRPLTDKVNVMPIKSIDIDYTVTWFITAEQATQFAAIEERVKAAIEAYEAWQIERIGRDINPNRLVQLCLAAGAKRVEISGLEYTELGRDTVAHINSREIYFGAVESD